jgi:hypothetical protein
MMLTRATVIVAFGFMVLFGSVFAKSAEARPLHGASLTLCTYSGSYADDGCSGAASDGNFRASNFFTGSNNGYFAQSNNMLQNAAAYNPANPLNTANIPGAGIARQSGQAAYIPYTGMTASHPVPYSVAGVDFPLGFSVSHVAAQSCPGASAGLSQANCLSSAQTGYTGFKDPKYIANDPATGGFCTYQTAGGYHNTFGPQVLCVYASQNFTIDGYDFSANGCVALNVAYENTGNVTVTNNKFGNGPGCNSSMVGQGDQNGNYVNTNSAGGAYVTAYAGDRFKGYIVGGGQTLCVTDTNPADGSQGSVEAVNNNQFVTRDESLVMAAGNYLTAAGGSCASGTAYQLASVVTSNIGSSSSPVWFQEENNEFVVTAVNTGGMVNGNGQTMQADNNAPGGSDINGVPYQNPNFVTLYPCISSCPGQLGAYSLGSSTAFYTPPYNWVVGENLNEPWIQVTTAGNIYMAQNYIDLNDIQYPLGSQFIPNGVSVNGGNITTFKYNVVLHSFVKTVEMTANATGAIVMDDNYIEDYGPNWLTQHTEATYFPLGDGAGVSHTVEIKNNTILGAADMQTVDGGLGPLWLKNPNATDAATDNWLLTAKYNTLVVNKNQWNGDSTESTGMFLDGDTIYQSGTNIAYNFFDPTSQIATGGAGYCIEYNWKSGNPGSFNAAWLVNNFDLLNGYQVRNAGECPTSP